MAPRSRAALACLLALLAAAAYVGAAEPLGDWTTGTASFFGGPTDSAAGGFKVTVDSGSCGFGSLDARLYPFYNVVGLHMSNPLVKQRPQEACGSCLEVQCLAGNATCYQAAPLQVVVTDQCDEDCSATSINMHVFGFEQLAPISAGRIPVRFRLVACQPTDAITVKILNHRAEQGGWLRVAFKNVAGDGGLVAVDLRAAGAGSDNATTGAAWLPCRRTYGAVWEAGLTDQAQHLPPPPLDLRLTNMLGQQVVIRNAVAFSGLQGDVETTAQFPAPEPGVLLPPTHGAAAASEANLSAALAAAAAASQSVVVGFAVTRPANALAGPLPPVPGDSADSARQAPVPEPPAVNSVVNVTPRAGGRRMLAA